MIALAGLREADVQRLATPESFRRGEEYLDRGAVGRVVRRGSEISAAVSGSEAEPYLVRVALSGAALGATACTCPYDWGGVCKHVVAALLFLCRRPDEVEDRPPLAALLAPLDRDALQALALRLAEWRPDLVDLIAGLAQEVAGGGAHTTSDEYADLRREVRAVLQRLDHLPPADAYHHAGSAVAQVRVLAERARAALAAGDGPRALGILTTVTSAYLESWERFDPSGGRSVPLFRDLGALWTEAVLTADLEPAERDHLAALLDTWGGSLADAGLLPYFAPARLALAQCWCDPALVATLTGEPATPAGLPERASVDDSGPAVEDIDWDNLTGDWSDRPDESRDAGEPAAPWVEAAVLAARLAVLERQGRREEHLRLALACGRRDAYLTGLLRAGRAAEVVASALDQPLCPGVALDLARICHESGETDAALTLASATPAGAGGAEDGRCPAGAAHVCDPDRDRLALVRWRRDTAAAAGRQDEACAAAMAAVGLSLELDDFLAARALAGGRWSAVRADVLSLLREGPGARPPPSWKSTCTRRCSTMRSPWLTPGDCRTARRSASPRRRWRSSRVGWRQSPPSGPTRSWARVSRSATPRPRTGWGSRGAPARPGPRRWVERAHRRTARPPRAQARPAPAP
ncbi:MAG: hypothetical protein U0531_02830 [Dehalococcoidia bacterium]